MNEIVITGGSKRLKELVRSASEFYLKKLLPRHSLYIHIHLIPKLTQKESMYGDTIWDDQNYRPREFVIRLDSSVDKDTLIWTLAHEMIHVKQYAKGELYDYSSRPYTKWKGEQIDADNYQYCELPWEIEACELDKELYESYIHLK